MREVEAKFILKTTALLKDLQAIETIDGFTLSSAPKVKRIRDTYLDTADRRLLLAGYACRQRRIGNSRNVLLSLKQLVSTQTAIHSRQEWEIRLPQDVPPAHWPDSPVREMILKITANAPLQVLFRIYQTRTQREVLREGVPIAEWSIDEVRVRAANRLLKFAELEIELKPDGTQEDLEYLSTYVQDRWNLEPAIKSKFERALAFLNSQPVTMLNHPPKPHIPDVHPDDSIAEAARKILLFHWERMLTHERGVLDDKDSEEVHDMRVAIRRMRAALSLFEEFLDSEAFKPFRKTLRYTARALGAVRDLDVFYEKTQSYIETLPAERKSELEPLLTVWQIEHKRAYEDLMTWLESTEYVQFKKKFTEFLQVPGAGAAKSENNLLGQPRVRDFLPIFILRSWVNVRAYDELVSKPDLSIELLHQLRIASKGLRYALEFFEGVLPPEVRMLIQQVKQLQDHLGNLQDAVIACQYLRNFLVFGELNYRAFNKETSTPIILAPGVASYLAWRQAEIQAIIHDFPKIFAPIRDSSFKKRLFSMLIE